jgi:molybdopterin synthase sulfur carrier subunit
MNITLKYFGLIVEVTGCSEEIITTSATTIHQLLEDLFVKYPELQSKAFQVAQNKTIVDKNEPINHTEIALLPPFSGG